MIRRILSWFAVALLAVPAATILYLLQADDYQRRGSVRVAGLNSPVDVIRDEQGVPYILATTFDDAIRVQGWVTAQDRLLQLEIERRLANGQLAEIFGEGALDSDIQVRVAGIAGYGRRHAAVLGDEDRRFYQLYLDGLNAYIRDRSDEHQFGFALLGIQPQEWSLADMLSLQYFLNWASSSNLEAELISLELIGRVGAARAASIAQVSVNPDDGSGTGLDGPSDAATVGIDLDAVGDRFRFVPNSRQLGSNQWAVSGARSASGAPVVVNDPHVDSRTLPGIWHPLGLITPGFRAVGLSGPGLPGLAIGRTTHIAWGVTNSYGDLIDLYIEREDPAKAGHYLEGEVSLPFTVSSEVIRVRARPGGREFRDVPLTIRRTRRGPVISDHRPWLAKGGPVSMRWAPPEAMSPAIGARALLLATNVHEARAAIGNNSAPYNYVIADTAGNIAHATAGRVPIRRRGDGSVPLPVTDGSDAWGGFIPWQQMPGALNPARGWAGNANHRTLPADYPYAYSTYFAASWRYRRMLELLDAPGRLGAADHWRFMHDTRNVMAAAIAPVMAAALHAHADTRELGDLLAGWNHDDDPELVAPTIFQAVYRQFAMLTFRDELGDEISGRMLGLWYYWHERLARMVATNDSPWFDDVGTPPVESRDDLFHRAALAAAAELRATHGADPESWRWGRVHTVTFSSPLLPGKWAARWFGGGTRPKEGSGETLNRATYGFDRPYESKVIASLRFVADLGDPDRVMAVLPAGASGRQFDTHLTDQLAAWQSGEERYLWFSDAAIRRHELTRLKLLPAGAGSATRRAGLAEPVQRP